MTGRFKKSAAAGIGAVLVLGLAAGTLFLARLRSSVQTVLEARPSLGRPLDFVAVSLPLEPTVRWGGSETAALLSTPTGLLTAGGSGIIENGRRLEGLPTRAAAALATWRGQTISALAACGVFRRVPGGWEELRSGWGRLHVRALAETEAGELVLGAREGL